MSTDEQFYCCNFLPSFVLALLASATSGSVDHTLRQWARRRLKKSSLVVSNPQTSRHPPSSSFSVSSPPRRSSRPTLGLLPPFSSCWHSCDSPTTSPSDAACSRVAICSTGYCDVSTPRTHTHPGFGLRASPTWSHVSKRSSTIKSDQRH